jgi:uncharacterized protein with HEPN domain
MTRERQVGMYLRDMLDAAEKARRFIAGTTQEEFLENDEKIFAVTRALEVIGEAAKQVPVPVKRRYPEIPWRTVAGTRDKLILAYFDVHTELLWSTVEDDLPVLCAELARVLREMDED